MPKKRPRIGTYFENTYQPQLDAMQHNHHHTDEAQQEPALWTILQTMTQDSTLNFSLLQTLKKILPHYQKIFNALLNTHNLETTKILFIKILDLTKRDEQATQLLLKTIKVCVLQDKNRETCLCPFHKTAVTAALMTFFNLEQSPQTLHFHITLPHTPHKTGIPIAVQSDPIHTTVASTQTPATHLFVAETATHSANTEQPKKRKRNFLLAGLTALGTAAAVILKLNPGAPQPDPTALMEFSLPPQNATIRFATSTAASTLAATMGTITGTPRLPHL